jgi:hypothetical protein
MHETSLLFPVGTLDHGTGKQHTVGAGAHCPLDHAIERAQQWQRPGPQGLQPQAPHRTGYNPAACGGLKPFSVMTHS